MLFTALSLEPYTSAGYGAKLQRAINSNRAQNRAQGIAAADYHCRPDQHRYPSLTRTNLKHDPSRASLICSYMCGWYLIHWPCVPLR
jgi:hypothetical protein